jgi:hypothetical protein
MAVDEDLAERRALDLAPVSDGPLPGAATGANP